MAGREVYGFESSLKDLYKNASMIYVDDLDDEEISLFKKIGFDKFVKASPKKHDEMISFTSQLCHVISNAYALNQKSIYHIFFLMSFPFFSWAFNLSTSLFFKSFFNSSKFSIIVFMSSIKKSLFNKNNSDHKFSSIFETLVISFKLPAENPSW